MRGVGSELCALGLWGPLAEDGALGGGSGAPFGGRGFGAAGLGGARLASALVGVACLDEARAPRGSAPSAIFCPVLDDCEDGRELVFRGSAGEDGLELGRSGGSCAGEAGLEPLCSMGNADGVAGFELDTASS